MTIEIEELKLAAPIAEYVKKHYSDKIKPISETKTVLSTLCGWHQESEGSLKFFKNTNTYKCFGCGEHGDVITLVMSMENATFQEACKIIGDNVGFPIVLEPPNPEHIKYKAQLKKDMERYHKNLKQNQPLVYYLAAERGLTKQSIVQFQLGLTDKEEYKFNSTSNICNRLTFPIMDTTKYNPECIGFGFRTLIDENPKYINSSNYDPVFVKSNCLYGYNFAYDSIKEQDHVIIVEGYIDVIAMHQSGISNVAGLMGTAFTESQAKQLFKVTKNITLMLDGDKPGYMNAIKTLPLLLSIGFNVMLYVIENNMDPADLCKKHGFQKEILQTIITNGAKPAINIIVDKAVDNYEKVVTQERVKALRMVEPILKDMANESDKTLLKSMLYKRLNL